MGRCPVEVPPQAGACWLLVTFGLTDLFGKSQEDDPDVSGWEFELTMRIRGTCADETDLHLYRFKMS
ncbi:MAG TPA: hypothetical protein DHU96_13780 [Actinobacteria bacterium]|nr:hypothetical protein [Actinomycetota bacterium]